MRTRVKICGIGRPADAIEAARLGADAIGLVFWRHSPRSVTVDRANEVIAELPPFVTIVGLFVDPDAAEVRRVLSQVPLHMLQFHGDESPQFCASFGRQYIKAVRMRRNTDLETVARAHQGAAGLLLDTYVKGMPGGTGLRFDWSRVDGQIGKPIILAGGLCADNVAEAITRTRPHAVDVSGGVELSKGVKDAGKMAAFIRGVKNVV